MIPVIAGLLPALLGATVEVPAGADLAAALARARPGDTVRLAPGEHHGSLGRARGAVRVEGAGAGVTVVVAGEGEDGLVVDAGGRVGLAGLTLAVGPARSALKILGGEVDAEDVALVGGAVGAMVDSGRLAARELTATGGYGVLLREGAAAVDGGALRGGLAAVGQLGGELTLRRVVVTGPAEEGGVSCTGGVARLTVVTIRAPGPSGLSVTGTARVEASGLVVSGATEEQGFLGDCVQVRRGSLTLSGATLAHCGGAALEASGGEVKLRGVDAAGGSAGCLAFVDRATGDLSGTRCTGQGPALVAASGSQVTARMDRWLVDPVLWVDCGSGARVRLGAGEQVAEPCHQSGGSGRKPAESLDKTPRP
jgi:hypothetical protein